MASEPSWLATFLADPRRTFLRRALFQIHLWVGIGLGVYVFLICVSGSALVFHHELSEIALAGYHHVPAGEQPDEAAGRRRLTLTEVAAIMGRDRPDLRILSLRPPELAEGTFEAGVLSNRKYHLAYVHPVTGAITGPVPPGGAVLSFLHELHANLLSLAGMGRWLNGIGGGFLFLLCVTGIIIWWPGRGRWARAMKVNGRANWKRVNLDLHNATGFWLLLPIAVLAITGSYFTWPRQYRAVVASMLPVTAAEPPKSNPKNKGLTPPSIDDLVERARVEAPGLSLVRVGVPTGPEQVYTVFFRRCRKRRRRGAAHDDARAVRSLHRRAPAGGAAQRSAHVRRRRHPVAGAVAHGQLRRSDHQVALRRRRARAGAVVRHGFRDLVAARHRAAVAFFEGAFPTTTTTTAATAPEHERARPANT